MLVDISCNITDSQFKDIDKLIKNCKNSKVLPLFVGLDFQTSCLCASYAEKYNTFFYGGIHPLHSKDSKVIPIVNDRLIAIGECGLDYYRLEYSPKDKQKDIFINQLDLQGERYFLHSRESHRDMMEILSDYSISGVFHSFTGTIEESKEIIKKGYFIGINGCSLKNEESIEIIKELPLDKILIETDSPYCKIRKSYAGFKYLKNYTKSKNNEPSLLREVLECIGEIKEIELSFLEEKVLENTKTFYGVKIINVLEEWENKFVN